MDVREIWPEPRITEKERSVPNIPEEVEVFQRKIARGEEMGERQSLRKLLSDIVEIFVSSARNSSNEKIFRDVEGEVKKIAHFHEGINREIAFYREAEAKARVISLLKKQINKKQNLINKLKLKEK